MARLASIKKNNRKKEISTKYYKYRDELREKAVNFSLSEEERTVARQKLQALPRNTSPNRVTTRCQITGRPRGNYKKFGLSRIAFRQLALDGKLPGVTKASW
ncbi:MAG: 30S ribosomal protein S14 [Bdellovibrio sp.]|nr:30S ribosomal protein S14 [Bdellovibrio sp.]